NVGAGAQRRRRRRTAADRASRPGRRGAAPGGELAMSTRVLTLVIVLVAAACAPKRVDEEPIIRNGERIPDSDATVAAVRREAEARREEQAARRDELAAEALATCTGAICEALTRGEAALEMTEAQVLAAARPTDEPRRLRRHGGRTGMGTRPVVA